jgi:hypothetical protein
MLVSTLICLEDNALAAAKQSIYNNYRPKVCFVYLKNNCLLTLLRVYAFYTPSDLSKHFRRKHLQQIDANVAIKCKLCKVTMQNKMHF